MLTHSARIEDPEYIMQSAPHQPPNWIAEGF